MVVKLRLLAGPTTNPSGIFAFATAKARTAEVSLRWIEQEVYSIVMIDKLNFMGSGHSIACE